MTIHRTAARGALGFLHAPGKCSFDGSVAGSRRQRCLPGCPRSHERYVYALASLEPDLLARSSLAQTSGEVQHGRIHTFGVVIDDIPDGSRVEAASCDVQVPDCPPLLKESEF